MGQTLCKWFPSMRTVCAGTQEAAGSREPGESKVSLHAAPRRRAEGCWGSASGGEGRQGTQGSSAPWPGGPQLGCGCLLAPLGMQCSVPSPSLPLALPLSWHSWHRAAPEAAPGDTWPRKALTAVILPFPACVLCGRVDEDSSILGHRVENGGFYFHTFCAVSSHTVPDTFLQPVIPSILP